MSVTEINFTRHLGFLENLSFKLLSSTAEDFSTFHQIISIFPLFYQSQIWQLIDISSLDRFMNRIDKLRPGSKTLSEYFRLEYPVLLQETGNGPKLMSVSILESVSVPIWVSDPILFCVIPTVSDLIFINKYLTTHTVPIESFEKNLKR